MTPLTKIRPLIAMLALAGCGHALAQVPAVPVPENEMALAAARQGNLPLWRDMLKLGATPLARDAGGNTALVMAVLSEREDMLREVLNHDVDLNAVGGGGMTALSVATTRGHVALVRRLLAAGARPDVADATGATPLAVATTRSPGCCSPPAPTPTVQTNCACARCTWPPSAATRHS
jgi:Ankyrin repeats (many copies)